jgi:very-short-patch-repair endonuclease
VEVVRWNVPLELLERLRNVAREFRKEPTASEAVLWRAIRGRALEGRKFRREQPIGPFVVDFYCPAERLVVEVDGGVHESQVDKDRARQECLEALGLRFVRLPAAQVANNLSSALDTIRQAFTAVAVLPSPLVGEGPGVRGRTATQEPEE